MKNISSSKLIVRIDDVGWTGGSKRTDTNLRYWEVYRGQLFKNGVFPVVWCVIPATMRLTDMEFMMSQLTDMETIAVHGYDHAEYKIVEEDDMIQAVTRLRPLDEYIVGYAPPFNRYDIKTIKNWSRFGIGKYFFGGQYDRDHKYGKKPVQIHGVTHLSTGLPWYGHDIDLIRALDKSPVLDYPFTLTAHCTWSWKRIDLVEHLGDRLRRKAKDVREVAAGK